MVQALLLRAAAGRAAAAGFWKTRRFCTASNAAIGRLWVWGVSHIALPSWSASPPHAPQTHGRVQTQLHQGAGCPGADLDRATPHTHAARPRPAGRRPTAPMLGAPSGMRAMARGAASADPRGSCHQPRRYHVSPAKWLRRPILRGRTRHAVDLESTLLLSILNALALISSLYYTLAPQSLHASPPTRAPHIYVSSPSPRRLLASPQEEVLAS
jgi:hypothetical protein